MTNLLFLEKNKPMKTKNVKGIVLAVMILVSTIMVELGQRNEQVDLKGGACAALAGAYTNDGAWVTVGFAMMEYSSWMAGVPGFQGAAALGFL
jgi:hypothetical protein